MVSTQLQCVVLGNGVDTATVLYLVMVSTQLQRVMPLVKLSSLDSPVELCCFYVAQTVGFTGGQ